MLITIFAPSNVHLLEIAAVRDALFEANCRMQSGIPYRMRLVTEHGTPAESASGVKFTPDAGMQEATDPFDTLIVLGLRRARLAERGGHALAAPDRPLSPGRSSRAAWKVATIRCHPALANSRIDGRPPEGTQPVVSGERTAACSKP